MSSDGSENVTGLDLSDFPALADRSRREGTGNPTPVLNPLAGRAPYGRQLISLYQSKTLFKAQLEYQRRTSGETSAPITADCVSVIIPSTVFVLKLAW